MLNHKGTQELRTKRLLLRKIKVSDYKDIYKYTSKEEVARYVTWNVHKNIEDTKNLCRLWAKELESREKYHWAIVFENTVIGNIEIIGIVDDSAFLGWQLDSEYWNMGIMTEAASAVRDYLFSEIGIEGLYASHIKENIGSGRVMQKIGMTEITKKQYETALKSKSRAELYGLPCAFYALTRKERSNI